MEIPIWVIEMAPDLNFNILRDVRNSLSVVTKLIDIS
jgi:hypothetical protein